MGYRNYSVANGFIVDKLGNGDFTTIGAALTAAVSGDTIFIRPGTYTENPTLVAGVNLTAFDADALTPNVIINGTCTLTGAGTVSISGISLQTNSAFCLAVTGSSNSIVNLTSCNINCLNNTGISFTSSGATAGINLTNCTGNIATTGITLFSNSASSGKLSLSFCALNNTGASTTASATSGVETDFNSCSIKFPLSTSSAAKIQATYCNINTSSINTTSITTAGTGVSTLSYCDVIAGSASALSIGSGTVIEIFESSRIESSNTNAITGAGQINYGLIVYTGASSTNNVTTQDPFPTQPATTASAWVLLQTQTASSSANIAFTSTNITTKYKNYAVLINNVLPATNEVGFQMNVSTNNGSSYLNTGYNANSTFASTGGVGQGNSTTTAILTNTATGGNALSSTAGGGWNGTVFLQNITTGSGYPSYSFQAGTYLGTGAMFSQNGGGTLPTTSVINNIQFIMTSGNIASGTFSLYGITS
jgi:hypothetical protein